MRTGAMSSLLAAAIAISSLSVGWTLSFKADMDPIRVSARPGQVANRTFQMFLSPDEQKTYFRLHIDDWWRSENGKQTFYRAPGTPGNPKHSCAKWITLNPVEASVDPGGVLSARVTIAIPDDAKPGGYWCALTLDEVSDPYKAQAGIGASFQASISVGIYVYISPIERDGAITDLTLTSDQATIKLANKGDSPLGVEGKVEFVKPGEKKAFASSIIPRGVLLPEPINTGLFSAILPDAQTLPSGHYIVRAILDIGLEHYIGVQKEMDVKREKETAAKSD